MKRKIGLFIMTMCLGVTMSYAADEQSSVTTPPPMPQSFGAQAGEAARELQGTAGETLSTGAMKVGEASAKVQSEVQETVKTLQQQWDVLAKQLQEKTKEIQAQLQQQWQDFNKSFNQPPK